MERGFIDSLVDKYELGKCIHVFDSSSDEFNVILSALRELSKIEFDDWVSQYIRAE